MFCLFADEVGKVDHDLFANHDILIIELVLGE